MIKARHFLPIAGIRGICAIRGRIELPFVELRERLWIDASRSELNGLIFTKA